MLDLYGPSQPALLTSAHAFADTEESFGVAPLCAPGDDDFVFQLDPPDLDALDIKMSKTMAFMAGRMGVVFPPTPVSLVHTQFMTHTRTELTHDVRTHMALTSNTHTCTHARTHMRVHTHTHCRGIHTHIHAWHARPSSTNLQLYRLQRKFFSIPSLRPF